MSCNIHEVLMQDVKRLMGARLRYQGSLKIRRLPKPRHPEKARYPIPRTHARVAINSHLTTGTMYTETIQN